jgi:ribonucleoside-diphosphate reductase alpha chain
MTAPDALPPETLAAFGGDELRARVYLEKYALRDLNDQVVEILPQQMWDRVARELASVEATPELHEHWRREFRRLLDSFRFLPGGRILHGAGNPRKVTLLNCYFSAIRGDSLEEIYATAYRAAKTYSRGGGIGVDVSPLRPAGAAVHNAARHSTGAVSFMELYSVTTGLIGQSGRRGALMLTIADHHPDVLEFCRVKRNLTSVRFANISVRLSDAFMRAVDQDGPWTLWFESPETGRIERRIRARDLWDELIRGARDWAEPGCLFWDRVIEGGTSNYDGMTPMGTNPCVTGDTRVSTSAGLTRIDDLASAPSTALGATLDSRVGPQFGLIARAWKTGRKPVVRIETRDGHSIRCTPDHRVLTANRGWIAASDLRPGDALLAQNRKGGFGTRGTYDLGLALGWLVADGTVSSAERQAVLQFYADKRSLAPVFQKAVSASIPTSDRYPAPSIVRTSSGNRVEIQSARLLATLAKEGFDPLHKHELPELIWQGSEGTVRGFLQAVFTADGTVVNAPSSRRSIRLTSVNLGFLRSIQLLLAHFGIFSRIYRNRRASGPRLMPDGRGGEKRYDCDAIHELAVARSSIEMFARDIGFIPGSRKQDAMMAMLAEYSKGPYRDRYITRVLSVTPDGEEDVYDLHEPVSGAFIANGITAHNCSEIPLEDGGACNLGSLNLTAFVLSPFAPEARIDTEALDRAVHVAVRFLDNVLTYNEGRHALPEQEAAARRGRRVGLGIAGLGDMLVMLGLRYDSAEAISAAGQLMRRIKEQAYIASADLAAEKGPFEAWDPDAHMGQPFFGGDRFPADLAGRIRRDGLRNVSLLTIPPTGSISAMAGITNGLEPVFALSYIRRSESLSQEFFTVLHPLVRAYLQRAGQEIDAAELARARDPHTYLKDRLPEAFVVSHEIDPIKRVDMQAALQAHIDQSISSTLNLPREATADTVAQVYFHAWRSGLKGISVYREGSREGVLLTPDEARRQHKLVALAETVRATALAAAPDLALDGGAPEEQIESAVRALADRLRGSPVQLQLTAPTEAEPLMRRPQALAGTTYRVPTATGTMFVTINELDGQPVEVFCRLGKGGSHAEADSEMAGRLISVALRLQAPVPRTERLRLIQEQLEGIGGGDSYGFGPNKVKSIADAIAKAIGWHLDAKRQAAGEAGKPETPPAPAGAAVPAAERQDDTALAPIAGGSNGNLCPQCHQYSLITDQGCTKCRECPYKEC